MKPLKLLALLLMVGMGVKGQTLKGLIYIPSGSDTTGTTVTTATSGLKWVLIAPEDYKAMKDSIKTLQHKIDSFHATFTNKEIWIGQDKDTIWLAVPGHPTIRASSEIEKGNSYNAGRFDVSSKPGKYSDSIPYSEIFIVIKKIKHK